MSVLQYLWEHGLVGVLLGSVIAAYMIVKGNKS